MLERRYWKFALLISLCLLIFNLIQLAGSAFWLQMVTKLSFQQLLTVVPPTLILRVALALFIITVTNALIATCFRTTSRLYAISFVFYIFSFILTFHPALLQSQHHLSKLFTSLTPFGGPVLFVCSATLLFLHPLYRFIKNCRRAEKKHRLALQGLTLAAMGWFLFVFNNPLLPYQPSDRSPTNQARPWSKHDIILLGIDGLRPDVFQELIAQGRFPSISKFLAQSHQFSKAVSPIARTHPAFHSIFHGKPPSRLSIRTNNSFHSLDSDASLKGSYLEKLKTDGYFVEIGLTDTSHSSYRKGLLIDSVLPPPAGAYNIALPHFFKDLSIWALFNNPLGSKVIPELVGNSAFSDTYRHEHFLRTVIDAVDKIEARTNPSLSIYHNVALHWPGSTHYPDFSCHDSIRDNSNVCLRYGTHRELGSASAFSLETTRRHNIEIYRKNLNHLLESYLEPLFRNLDQRGILAHDSQAVVILMSDHGETFYSDKFLPMGKVPNHGALASLDDDSHNSVLAIRLPSSARTISKNITEQPFPLYDIFPLIDWALEKRDGQDLAKFQPRHPLLESDRWLTPLFPYQGLQLPFGNGFSAYDFDVHGDVVLREDLEDLVNFSKNIGYVDIDGTHVSVLAEYGFFGDDLKSSHQIFEKDHLYELRRRSQSLSHAAIVKLLEEDATKNSDLAYVHALELLYRYIQPGKAFFVLKNIFESPRTPQPLVEMALIHIARLCTLSSGSVGKSALQYMQATDLINTKKDFTFHYEAIRSQFLCFMAHGQFDDAHGAMHVIVRNYFDDLLRRPISRYFWRFAGSRNRAIRNLNEEVAELAGDLHELSKKSRHLTTAEFDQLVKALRLIRDPESSELEIADETKRVLGFIRSPSYNQMYGALDPWFFAAFDTQTESPKKLRILLVETLKGYPTISMHLMAVIGNLASYWKLVKPETVADFWQRRETETGDRITNAREDFAKVLLRELEANQRK